MRNRSILARVVAFGGLALAGLIGGHALGYAIAVPDAQHRAALLDATGHSYLPSVSWAALVCGLAALIAGVASGFFHRGSARGELGSVARAVVTMQAGAFALIEVVERIVSGTSLDTLSPKLLLVGVVVQILVGLVVAALLVGLRRVGARLRAAAGRVAIPALGRPLPRTRLLVRRSWHQTSIRERAPPLCAAA